VANRILVEWPCPRGPTSETIIVGAPPVVRPSSRRAINGVALIFFEWQNRYHFDFRFQVPFVPWLPPPQSADSCYYYYFCCSAPTRHRGRRVHTIFVCVCACAAVCRADRPISRSSPTPPLPVAVSRLALVCMCGAVRVRVRVAVSLRLLPTTTRLNGKREQRCPLRFHMSSMFENRQACCAHLRRTRQKIQFGSKDQRLFAYKGKAHTHTPVVDIYFFYFIFFFLLLYCRSCLDQRPTLLSRDGSAVLVMNVVEVGLEKKFRAAIFVFVGPIEFRYCISKRVWRNLCAHARSCVCVYV